MRQFAGLEIDDDIALENRMIENQIDVEVIAVQRQPFLPCDKRESFAKF